MYCYYCIYKNNFDAGETLFALYLVVVNKKPGPLSGKRSSQIFFNDAFIYNRQLKRFNKCSNFHIGHFY